MAHAAPKLPANWVALATWFLCISFVARLAALRVLLRRDGGRAFACVFALFDNCSNCSRCHWSSLTDIYSFTDKNATPGH